MKRYLYITVTVAVLSVLCGCKQQPKCEISGTITEATDSVLYLENVGIDGVTRVDSVKLKADGSFKFERENKETDFYRLRIARQIINLSVDSTEHISVKAAYPTMAQNYSVEGSRNCSKIQELALHQAVLQAKVNAIIADPTLRMSEVQDSLLREVAAYKDMVKRDYIYEEPGQAYAYFALFQTIVAGYNYSLIFNPRASEEDIKVFAAVATSWALFHKGSLRAEQLHNMALEGMRNVRIIRAQNEQWLDASQINETNIVDIVLPDNQGVTRRLSELTGKVVLLDFCAFAQDGTNQRMMAMRELYEKYHSRGLEIYQVSIDADAHFWQTQTAALPWVCVLDQQGVNSQNLLRYNVQAIPTYFLLDKNCTPVKRDNQVEDVEKEIEKLL